MPANDVTDVERVIIYSLIKPHYLLMDDSALLELSPEYFADNVMRAMFIVIRSLYESKGCVDSIVVYAEMDKLGFEVPNDLLYSAEHLNVNPELMRQYIEILKERHFKKKIADELKIANPDITHEKLNELIKLAEDRDGKSKQITVHIKEFAEQYCKDLLSKKYEGIDTGYHTYDNNVHPQAGDLEVIGARTNVGKTVFLTNILANMLRRHIPCLYCPTEMRPAQLVDRIVPLMSAIKADTFRSRGFSIEDMAHISNLPSLLKPMPLSIMDIASPSMYDIKQSVRHSQCKVLLLDYLGRCSMSHEQTRMREIEKFMVDLKSLCLNENILCFLAVQLTRATDFNKNSSPRLADLSDSSAIEKEADSVCFLWKDPASLVGGRVDTISAIIAKNRHGRLNQFSILFNRDSLKMTEPSAIPKGDYGNQEGIMY